MTDAERIARETFYGNLWVIDGRGFRHNFDIYHLLSDHPRQGQSSITVTPGVGAKKNPRPARSATSAS
ncbi:hypothetical protein [Mesorhizobium sp. M0496]|uniref:hypothetical protein n=1 Tax=Mesorhizobium sp. M0496 TaxID=2956952 RepID=UPI003335A7AC